MKKTIKKTNHIWIDCIKILASILVVYIHVNFDIWRDADRLIGELWLLTTFIEIFARTAVPIFIIISGYLLLNPAKIESVEVFVSKRFNKIIIPTLFWMLFYLIWSDNIYNIQYSFFDITKIVITGFTLQHLYFMGILVGLYAITPILRVYAINTDKQTYFYAVILTLFVSIAMHFVHVWIIGDPLVLIFEFWIKFVGYFMFGGYISKYGFGFLENIFHGLTSRFWVSILACISLGIITTFLHYYAMSNNDNLVKQIYFLDYSSITVTVTSILSFVFLGEIFRKMDSLQNEKYQTLIKTLSSATLGIYLSHIAFRDLLNIYVFVPIFGDYSQLMPVILLVYIFSLLFSTYFTSLAFVLLVKKIKYVNKTAHKSLGGAERIPEDVEGPLFC